MIWAKTLDFLTSDWLLLAQVAENEAADGGGGNAQNAPGFAEFLLNPMNFLLLLLLLFYFMVLMPQQRQMRAQQRTLADALANLKKNDRVVTTGGIHGVVLQVPETGPVTIRIDEATGAKLTVNRDAIARVGVVEPAPAAKNG
jgi:preprotein translocase subunit YajC